ncbi:MAG: metallophosphoesterase [Bacteroidales bacterium]|nr:metallophosphoesterase [Bacteroidales bacterium]
MLLKRIAPVLLFLGMLALPLQAKTVRTENDSIRIVAPEMQVTCGPWLSAVGEKEFTVCWITSTDAAGWVEIAPDDENFYARERKRYYQTFQGRCTIGKLHRIRITGLEKGTTYRYCIFSEQVLKNEGNRRIFYATPVESSVFRQNPYKVTTLDPDKANCKFAVFNDMHERDSIFRAQAKPVAGGGYDFVLFNGDMTSQIESVYDIETNYLRSACNLFAGNIPIFFARGNHENRGAASYEFLNLFPTSTGNTYYTFREGPAFFVVLDGGEDKPDSNIHYYGLSCYDSFREDEADWLKTIVSSKEYINAPVRIVIIHMPPNANGWRGVREIERLFVPILNGTDVALMICGHTHRPEFHKAGTKPGNCDFPIFVNTLRSRADIEITADSITISAGKNSHVISLN